MLIKIFNKKITLDCFTCYPTVYEFFKFKKGEEAFPVWAKDELKNNEDFKNLYNNLTIPIWTDLTIDVDTYGNVKYELSQDEEFKLENYPPDKYHQLTFSNVILLKLRSPWLLKEKNNVRFTLTPLLWNHLKQVDKFWFLNKSLSFKKPLFLDIDFLVSIKKNYQGIERGTNIMQLIPSTEKEINIQHHLVDEKEIHNLNENNR
jgi:hypothetical protein